MVFRDEESFENHIRDIIRSEIATRHSGFTVLRYRGVTDIIICRRTPAPEAVFFVEVKYAKDMISVSEGIQSEILFRRPAYIKDHLLWLIGSNKHEGQYWLLDSSELAEYVPNIKHNLSIQNNISRDVFRSRGLTKSELIKRLREWLHRQP